MKLLRVFAVAVLIALVGLLASVIVAAMSGKGVAVNLIPALFAYFFVGALIFYGLYAGASALFQRNASGRE